MNAPNVMPEPQPSGVSASAGAPLLDMRNITKEFPSGRVLHGIDFQVQAGEVHALVGENGAGKSTLMKILAGLYPDHGGEILVDGNQSQMRSPRASLAEGVAVIYQEFALAPDLSVAENIALGRERRHHVPGVLNHRQISSQSRRESESLGIDLPMDTPVCDLVVGDQQLTEIVKAVARRARVLVMDEPTARLSSTERDRLFAIIRLLAERGVGVVYISHFLEEIFAVASKVTVLRDGHLVTCQPLTELDVPQLARLMVGERFQEIELSTRRHLRHKTDEKHVALALEGFGIDNAVAPLDLTLHRGEVVGLAGLQSSSRTELAEAIIGDKTRRRTGRLRTPTFTGLPRNPREALKAGLLMLPANRKTDGILETRPVSDNIAVGALRKQLVACGLVKGGPRRKLVSDLIDRFAVRPTDPSAQISSLSGGNQQKVLFARATAAQADVLILDQPTTGVDIGATVELYEQVDALTASGVAVVLISDDLTELLRLSDTVIIMREGVASAPRPAAEFDRATLLAAITGGSPLDQVAAADATAAVIQ